MNKITDLKNYCINVQYGHNKRDNIMKLEKISLTNNELLTISKYFKQEIQDLRKFNNTNSTNKELKDIEKQIEVLRNIRVKIAMIRYS